MGKFSNWKYANNHVEGDIENGEYLASPSTIVMAGPSELTMIDPTNETGDVTSTLDTLYPIGMLDSISLGQNRQLQQIYEIGSLRSYSVSGRTFCTFTGNRILFYGPSLLRLYYAMAPTAKMHGSNQLYYVDNATTPGTAVSEVPAYSSAWFQNDLQIPAGYGGVPNSQRDNKDFFINLASDLFSKPFGMCLLFRDANNRSYGALYMENCYVETHSIMVNANNIVIAEGSNGRCERFLPVQVLDSVGT